MLWTLSGVPVCHDNPQPLPGVWLLVYSRCGGRSQHVAVQRQVLLAVSNTRSLEC